MGEVCQQSARASPSRINHSGGLNSGVWTECMKVLTMIPFRDPRIGMIQILQVALELRIGLINIVDGNVC